MLDFTDTGDNSSQGINEGSVGPSHKPHDSEQWKRAVLKKEMQDIRRIHKKYYEEHDSVKQNNFILQHVEVTRK